MNDQDELVDVLDAFGYPTGQVLPKSQVHTQELWHAGSHIWIYNGKGELLLQRRHPNKDIYPDTWDISAAGHLSAGDTPAMAAMRETAEEIGLQLRESDLEYIGITRAWHFLPTKGWDHRVFDHNFIAFWEGGTSELTLQADETTDARWLSLDQIESDLQDPERRQQYAGRMPYLYAMAIAEIRKALARRQGK